MRPEILFSLFADVSCLPKVGAKTKEALLRLRCSRIIDLVQHMPVSVITRRFTQELSSVQDGEIITTEVTIDRHYPPENSRRFSKKHPYKIRCYSPSSYLTLVFFNDYAAEAAKRLQTGERRMVSGKVDRFGGELQMVHPDYIATLEKQDIIPAIEPVYPLTYALTLRQLWKIIQTAMGRVPVLPEWIDSVLLAKKGWKSWKDALTRVHHPESGSEVLPHFPTRQRLAYDELLANQLALKLTRHFRQKQQGQSIAGDGHLRRRILGRLGFTLTEGQKQALTEITQDQASPHRMMRLLQGDVGSGKTIVALCTMLNAIECGKQAAFMAPTELLSRQHFTGMAALCGEDVRIALLTGSTKTKERQEILSKLAAGEIDLLVGTHALFQEQVVFHDLAAIIIDEQHRFGVNQRLALAEKGTKADVLLMTATPIPRTLTMAAYGDMDVSRIADKPMNRLPITTRMVSLERESEVIASLTRAMEKRSKIYWICPLIEEAEGKDEKDIAKSDLAAAMARYLQFSSLFEGKVGLVHGKMKAAERDKVMLEFAFGGIDLLVATTVIEVGIDVPEASVIIIEHAERFGLSQLHQLRGRVGRGAIASSCILLYSSPLSDISKARLKVIRDTEDGFLIAEEDLRLRGEGELLGTKQSGLPDFKMVDMEVHQDLLALASEDAESIIASDPMLRTERGKALRVLLYLFGYDNRMGNLG
jgi:ATP-dependent DNA helicase RecG